MPKFPTSDIFVNTPQALLLDFFMTLTIDQQINDPNPNHCITEFSLDCLCQLAVFCFQKREPSVLAQMLNVRASEPFSNFRKAKVVTPCEHFCDIQI